MRKDIVTVIWTFFLIASIALICLLSGCASFTDYSFNTMWTEIQHDNPECRNRPMPDIRWTSGDVPEIPYGAYIPQQHLILLNPVTVDYRVIQHEMYHACLGDLYEERIYLFELKEIVP